VIFATAFVNLLDALTTIIGLQLGLSEANPTSIFVQKTLGDFGFVLEKAGIVLFLVWLERFLRERLKRLSPLVWYLFFFAFVGVFVAFSYYVVNNFILIALKLARG
jgi:hypothetical protein